MKAQEKLYGNAWQKCTKAHYSLIPVIIKISMMSAVRSVLPCMASLHCCRFHLGPAWWRHMNSLGLGPMYTDKSSDFARWLKLFFGLPLLPSNEVPDVFAVDIMSKYTHV